MKIRLFNLLGLNELEKQYYQHFLPARNRQFILAAAIMVAVISVLSLNDFIFYEGRDGLQALLLYRAFGATLSIASILIIRKNTSTTIYNIITLIWLVTCCVVSVCVTASRPEGYIFGFIWDIIMIFAIYLMVPAMLAIQGIVAGLYTLAIAGIWIVVKLPELEPAANISVLLALVTANAVGFLFSWQLKRSAREQFILYKEEQEMKEQLDRQNNAKNKFFSIISHDLRSPMGNMVSICDLALENNQMERQEIIDLVQKNAMRTLTLLENLLNWAKSESGHMVPVPVNIPLAEFVAEKMLFFEYHSDLKQISLLNNVQDDIVVYADYNMIDTVLRNLISNAIKFTPERGRIEVAAEAKSGMVEIAVQDNGIGINTDILSHLFEVDFQHSTTGTNHEAGTGLGLKLCKEFVTKNGGDIWVESQENTGTTFTFSLPLATQ